MKKVSVSAFLLLSFCFYGILQAQQGNWQVVKTVNSVPDCSECGMAAINEKLYLIGNDGDGATPVKCLDPGSLTWTKLAEAPVIMPHFQAVGYNNKVYVLDAFSGGGFPDQVPMANVYSYDTKSNTWEKGGEIPADRRRAGAGTVEYISGLKLTVCILHGTGWQLQS